MRFFFPSCRCRRQDPKLLIIYELGFVPLSKTGAALPQQQASECATGGAVTDRANNPCLLSDCEALLTARDTLAVTRN